MLIAQQQRKENIAEYLLYMWQIEDLLRACSFDAEKIEMQLVRRFAVDENTQKEISRWYNNLSVMMENEHVQESGHLQVLVNLVDDLNEFHRKMLEVQVDKEYVRLYQSNSTAIAEIMQKAQLPVMNEVEACLNALYGFMLLKLKNSEISEQTQKSVQGLGRMIGHLSARYIQFENDDFTFDD